MATTTAEQLIEAWASGWSSGDIENVLPLFTDDCVYEDVTLSVVNKGHEQLKAFGSGFLAGASDLKVELRSSFVSGNLGGAEWTMTGTHQGDLPDLPATGKAFSIRGASVFEISGDKLSRCSDYWDMATFLKQLGFMS